MKLIQFKIQSLLLTYLLTLSILGYSQKKDSLTSYESSSLGVAASVWVDDIVISASRKGFDIEDFIQLMMNDTSMYHGFKRLRTMNYQFPHSINYYNRKGQKKDYYKATMRQHHQDSCRWNELVDEDFSKKYYRRKKFRYYTSSLFSRIFYTKDTLCTIKASEPLKKSKTRAIAYHVDLMKKIIFSPGLDIDIPFVGRRMALFSEKMRKYYDYTITSVEKNGHPCYLFSIQVKPKYADNRTNIIVRSLETYFKKSDFTVVERDYHMKYDNYIYDFDFAIHVEMGLHDAHIIPTYISYTGNWDIPLKKREIANFEVYFELN